MTEQTQSFHADGQAEHDGSAGGAGGIAGGAPEGREALEAIDRLLSMVPAAEARPALDAISLRLGHAYASLGPRGNGADEIPEAAVREAVEREAQSQREAEERAAATATAEQAGAAAEQATRSREAFEARRLALLTASHTLGLALNAVAEICGLLTWQPDRSAEADQAAVRAIRSLADFRSHLAAFVAAGPADGSGQARNPSDELGDRYGAALDALRELHRQVGAQVDLLGTDVGNTPALIAMERVVAEQAMRANMACQGLGMVLAETGMTR